MTLLESLINIKNSLVIINHLMFEQLIIAIYNVKNEKCLCSDGGKLCRKYIIIMTTL